MELLLGIILFLEALVLFVILFVIYEGDENEKFLVEQRTPFKLTALTQKEAVFTCKFPVVNKGKQDGTIMDAFPRFLLPAEQFDAVEVSGNLSLENYPRSDGYWEAFILLAYKTEPTVLNVKLTAKEGNIKEVLKDMVDMPIEIYAQFVGRQKWYITKSRIVMTAEEVAHSLENASVQ